MMSSSQRRSGRPQETNSKVDLMEMAQKNSGFQRLRRMCGLECGREEGLLTGTGLHRRKIRFKINQ